MSQSYIPNGTKIICTNMTNSTPQMLVVYRHKQTVHNTKGILLNKDDLKISDTLFVKTHLNFGEA